MQLLPALTREARIVSREKPAGYHLPYARHVDDHTIETRDGLLMQMIHLRGLLFETADSEEINYRKRLRDAMLQAIGSSRFALYHHIIRRRIDAELGADYPDPFSRELDAMWRARLAAKRLYVNDLFLTLIRRPLQGRVGAFDRLGGLFGRSADEAEAGAAYEVRQLDVARDALLAALGSYAPRLLGVYETAAGALLGAARIPLGALQWRDAAGADADAGSRRLSALPPGQLRPGDGRARPAAPNLERSFLGLVSIKDYPGQTAPGMLDELLRLPFELTVSQSFGFVERQAALGADEPRAAADALGRGRGGEPARRSVQRQGRGRRRPRRLRRASHDDRGPRRHARPRSTKASPRRRRRWPTSASSRCARRSRSSPPSGRNSRATSNISPGAA